MTIDQYRHYTAQRELLLVDALAASGKPIDGGKLPEKCTITTNGQEYKIRPIKAQTAAAYRKRFEQVDAAAKGMLRQQDCLERITVNMAGKQYILDPTPEQERERDIEQEFEATKYIYKELCGKKHRSELEQCLWEQLDIAFKMHPDLL